MASLPWLGLVVFVAATVAGATFAGVRGLHAWRALSSFRRRLDRDVMELTHRVDRLDAQLARLDRSSARLEEAQARLAESLRTAQVLFGALDEARQLASAAKAFAPR